MPKLKLPSDESEQLLVKSNDVTDEKYGKSPEKRSIKELLKFGVINLDKPSGPSSHEVVSWVRKILNIPLAGHGGTLDPNVTGVLPCALGKATRVLSALLSAGKEYVCVMYLHSLENPKKIEKVINLFVGKIYQTPPLKSSVLRKLRIREIYYNDILEIKNQHVLFRVGCEAGTYIRKLCYDIGEVLCSGANMLELRRTRVGNFREDNTLITLQNLKDAWEIYQEELDESYIRKIILPMERMVSHVPKIYIRDTAVDAICHGADLAASGICFIDARINSGDLVALMTLKKELIGFGQSLFSAIKIYKANNGIMIKIKKVFMDRGIYPHWSDKK